jgi:hypothetical protein
MRSPVIAFAAAALFMSVASPALAAAPVAGGLYQGFTYHRGERCLADVIGGCVTLSVNNDGGEFQAPSRVEYNDLNGCLVSGLLSDALADGPPSAGTVASDGTFRLTYRNGRRTFRIRGEFYDRGRRVRGTLRISGGRTPRACHGSRTVRFRARQVGRPNAPRPGAWTTCDEVITHDALGNVRREVRVFDRDAGCTRARAAARALRDRLAGSSPPCADPPAANSGCILGELSCAPVARGERDPAALVRCQRADRPGAAAELVAATTCFSAEDEAFFAAWALNVSCAEARAVAADAESRDCDFMPAGARCALTSYDCRRLGERDFVIVARCSPRTDPSKVVELEQ